MNQFQEFKKEKSNFIFREKNSNENVLQQWIIQIETLRKNVVTNLEFIKGKKDKFVQEIFEGDCEQLKKQVEQNIKD